MIRRLAGLAISAGLVTACGGADDAPMEMPTKSVEQTYTELAETTKNCALKDGEACYKLGRHFEYQNESAGIPDNLKIMMQTKIQETYKKSCDYGYKPACKKVKK